MILAKSELENSPFLSIISTIFWRSVSRAQIRSIKTVNSASELPEVFFALVLKFREAMNNWKNISVKYQPKRINMDLNLAFLQFR